MNFLSISQLIRMLLIIVGGFFSILISKKFIWIAFHRAGRKSRIVKESKRIATLRNLLESIASATIATFTFLMILFELGFDIAPILAGAGIIGLAVSFGSQSLIKDLIAGFFIIIENQYNVGDTVEIGGMKGTVNKINIRTTILKDADGNKIYILNSRIDKVKVILRKAKSS
ncbi:MAG: mechanosensitive ion channel family protein [Candidatus Paceibacterota bacterium]